MEPVTQQNRRETSAQFSVLSAQCEQYEAARLALKLAEASLDEAVQPYAAQCRTIEDFQALMEQLPHRYPGQRRLCEAVIRLEDDAGLSDGVDVSDKSAAAKPHWSVWLGLWLVRAFYDREGFWTTDALSYRMTRLIAWERITDVEGHAVHRIVLGPFMIEWGKEVPA